MSQTIRKLKPLLETPLTHNILRGGRGGGKSRGVAALLVKAVAHNPLNVFCGRETQKSLVESSFAMVKDEIYRQGYGDRFNIVPSKSLIECSTRGRFSFVGLKEHTVDSIKSYEGYHWAWVEEAQAMTAKSLNTLIPTLRTDGSVWIDFGEVGKYIMPLRLFVYTENPYTWDDPINTVLPDHRDDVQAIEVNYWDNPFFPASLEEERVQAKKSMLPDEYLRIWEGIPYEDAERAVIPRKAIQDAMERKVSTEGGTVTGADIARFGADRTVFVKRKGMQVVDIKVLSKKDTQEVARLLFDFSEGGRIMVDDTGVGGGVTDKLKDLKAQVVPVNFGRRARNKKKYPDIISEMWFNLADIIGEIGLPYDRELLKEMSSRHYKYTQDERRKIESKEEYKKRTGSRSPDLIDALILCYANMGGEMSVATL